MPQMSCQTYGRRKDIADIGERPNMCHVGYMADTRQRLHIWQSLLMYRIRHVRHMAGICERVQI